MPRQMFIRGSLVAAGVVLAFTTAAVAQDRHVPPPHDPAHAAQALTWCAAHLARNELVAALSDCDYAVAVEPKNPKSLSNRGSVWLLAGDPARAIMDFDAAIALVPEDASLYFNRGIAFSKLQQQDKAITEYSEAIRRRPDFAAAYYNRGFEFELKKMTTEALADYNFALKLAPDLKPAAAAIAKLSRGQL